MKALKLRVITMLLLSLLTTSVMAETVQNKTGYTVEFSGLVGGYVSNNPLMGSSDTALIHLDPGSILVRGHIMVYSKQAKRYLDNIVFVYKLENLHHKFFTYDLYQHIKVVAHNHRVVLFRP